mmetsp:Transcript_1750/g.4219  ORF Transcript_1750/g.4219 Transcript_1750/m.4219 type:complete len:154 (+) Transcript_1750:27-488(+)
MSMLRWTLVCWVVAGLSHAWVVQPQKRTDILCLQSTAQDGKVSALTLESLQNHEEEGEAMAASIARWLDKEWMPQEVHQKMGTCAKQAYIRARTEGDAEVMSIMMRVASELEQNWSEYDQDAFVNAWDVANYVSDYLTQRSGQESCSCSTPIH